jgi:heme/copper-type cytochrome/quinol oxidase subunit 2
MVVRKLEANTVTQKKDTPDNPAIYGYKKVIDQGLRSNSPWQVLAACTFGTALLVTLLTMRGMRRQGDTLDLTILSIVVAVSFVFGLAIGLTVLAYFKYKRLRTAEAPVPFWLRLLFDGQPLKLVFIGIPLLFIIAIAIGVMIP